MDRLLWFSLLLTYLPVTESMKEDEGCLIQSKRVVWREIGKNVALGCSVRSNCSADGLHYGWFAFKENFHTRLNLSSNPLKYTLEEASLRINSLHTNDSGVYYCAAASGGDPAPGAQHVGLGTTLVVREQLKTTVRPILLWIAFVLLAIYSLAIVILIIKKYGCHVNICRRMYKIENNTSKRIQFRNVLQEMYSRGNLDRSKNRSRNQVEAGSTGINNSADDIYQNV